MMRLYAGSLAAVGCLSVNLLSGAATAEQKPNVLFVIADDLCDWIGVLGGHPQTITPNLDKLARRGVTFTNAYAAVSLSNPSRVAMLSGISPAVTGIYDNSTQWTSSPVVEGSVSLGQHFKSNGYTTITAGKVYHAFPGPRYANVAWDDHTHQGGGYGPQPVNPHRPAEITAPMVDFDEWTGPDTDFPDYVNSRYIADFISGYKGDKPFMAAMGFYRPHNPWTAPKRYYDMMPEVEKILLPEILDNDLDDIPQYAIKNYILPRGKVILDAMKKHGLWKDYVKAYLACVVFMDDQLGYLLDALEKSGKAGNTIIVFVGDNGFHHGEKNYFAKNVAWREACHVPLIISTPAGSAKGARCEAPVSSLDIYPTLARLCGLPVSEQLSGVSLEPLLTDPGARRDVPAISLIDGKERALRLDNWSYILYADGSEELYDLTRDENEWHNLAGESSHAATKARLKAMLPKMQKVQMTPRK